MSIVSWFAQTKKIEKIFHGILMSVVAPRSTSDQCLDSAHSAGGGVALLSQSHANPAKAIYFNKNSSEKVNRIPVGYAKEIGSHA